MAWHLTGRCRIGAPCTYLYHVPFGHCDNYVHTTEYRFTSHLEVGPIPQVPWLCRLPQCLVDTSVDLHVSLGPLTPVRTYLVANKGNKRLVLDEGPTQLSEAPACSSCFLLGEITGLGLKR